MGNIIRWLEELGNKKTNKPNSALKEELFHKIDVAIKDGSDSIEDCVASLCSFSQSVIAPFYADHYWNYSEENRALWDRAVIHWAETNHSTQQLNSATLRIVSIIRCKLPKIISGNEVLSELQWLSLNDTKKSAPSFKQLREHSQVPDLRKLLSLDMTGWKMGQPQIFKMYEILFANSCDQETQKLYDEFLKKHEKKPDKVPVCKMVSEHGEDDAAAGSEKHSLQSTFVPSKSDKKTIDETMLSDGTAMAEALVTWTKAQKEKNAALRIEVQSLRSQLESASEKTAELSMAIKKLQSINTELESKLATAKCEYEALCIDKTKTENLLGQVQQMAENSVRQELDGFKAKLASALANTVKDFYGEYTDEEKIEVYKAFLEDMIGLLVSNGIPLEVK